MTNEICKVEGCNNKKHTKDGYCNKHHTQIIRHGRLTPERELGREKAICLVDNCDEITYAKNLCRYHWNLQRKTMIEKAYKLGLKDAPICQVDSCNDIVRAKGYCRRHYEQVQKYGEVKYIDNQRKENKYENLKVCRVVGCNSEIKSKGYCNKHYRSFLKYGDPLYKKRNNKCQIEGCINKYYAKGYCRKHYLEYIRTPRNIDIAFQ